MLGLCACIAALSDSGAGATGVEVLDLAGGAWYDLPPHVRRTEAIERGYLAGVRDLRLSAEGGSPAPADPAASYARQARALVAAAAGRCPALERLELLQRSGRAQRSGSLFSRPASGAPVESDGRLMFRYTGSCAALRMLRAACGGLLYVPNQLRRITVVNHGSQEPSAASDAFRRRRRAAAPACADELGLYRWADRLDDRLRRLHRCNWSDMPGGDLFRAKGPGWTLCYFFRTKDVDMGLALGPALLATVTDVYRHGYPFWPGDERWRALLPNLRTVFLAAGPASDLSDVPGLSERMLSCLVNGWEVSSGPYSLFCVEETRYSRSRRAYVQAGLGRAA
eukprot:tig00000492_g1434.t1